MLNRSGPNRSLAVPRMLMRSVSCERAKYALSHGMRRYRRLLGIEERGLGLGQAHGSLDSDSAGEESTIVKVVVAMNLTSTQGAPKEDG